MKSDYAHISIILDRTGSMEAIRDDTIGGFNAFINEQKDQPGEATLTLVQFDTQDPYEVIHRFEPVKNIPKLTHETYVPRASTPLLDAMGRGINDLEKSIADMKEDQRPSKVVMVFITDGQENSSCEFRKDQITKMLKKKQEDDWQIVFLSADLDAVNDVLDYGVRSGAVMAYDKNRKGTSDAWSSTSDRIARLRRDEIASVEFTDEDREKQDIEKEREKTPTK